MSKELKTAIEKDIEQKNIQFLEKDNNSDLIQAMKMLHSNENIESNTVLTQEQVNGLVMMDWAGNTYNIEFFKNYSKKFVKYVISGNDGRGRKEIIQIAEAIQKDKAEQNKQMIDLLGRR